MSDSKSTDFSRHWSFQPIQNSPRPAVINTSWPQNDIDYGYAGSTDDYGLLYSFPRKTGILLGGSVAKGDWSLEPRADEIRRMVDGHAYLASKLA